MERLYVLIRKDLSLGYQAVQGGHAVAEYMLKNDSWKNQYLIYLNVKDERDLESWKQKLESKGHKPIPFHEPDINNEMTAIAVHAPKELFKNLKLVFSKN